MATYGGGALAGRARDVYARQATLTASREMLVVLLYDGALARLNRAESALREGRRTDAAKALSGAYAVVSELRASLDFEQGGEIAEDLTRLYGFVLDRVAKCNATRDVESIREARAVLAKLKEGWDALVAGG
jgi:flagellar secretion chaperone FliS